MTTSFIPAIPHLRRAVRRGTLGVLLALAGSGCSEALDVPNTNSPTPESDTEAIVQSTYATFHNATIGGANDGVQTQMLGISQENFSALANFGLGLRSAIPRNAIVNTLGNPTAAGTLRDFSILQRTAAVSAGVLRTLAQPDFTLGDAPRNARARAFAFFTNGISLGTVAMVYDSAAIVTERTEAGSVPPLSGAAEIIPVALAQLDSAITIAAAAPSGGNGFPTPATWVRGNALSVADFTRLVRSYKARIRAGAARTPAERAAVDWAAVQADATNGITADFEVDMSPANGWDVVWVIQHYLFDTWHQMSPAIIGMADSSGGYDNWLAASLDDRDRFLIQTADRRFPAGGTRAAQQTASGTAPGATGLPYFRNRASADRNAAPYGDSFYDFYRFQGFYSATRLGRYPVFTRAENDMLAAEAAIRLGQFATAATLIDRTRVARGGLPSVAGITNLTTPVPGGASCVPRVPAPPSFTSTVCGNIFEAMKWEKRMETAYTGYGMWYFDGRGWGDLVEGSALSWPVPYQEMQVREKPFYNLGGVGLPGGAPRGTYGF